MTVYNLKNGLNVDKTFASVVPTLIIVNLFKKIENLLDP